MNAYAVHHLPSALALFAALPHVSREALTMVLLRTLIQNACTARTALRTLRDAPPVYHRIAHIAPVA